MDTTLTANTNADPAELARLDSLAGRWWDENSEFKPMHRINPHRLDWIEHLCALDGTSVLDVGCGGGILAEAMARRGARVTGIDLAGKRLAIARQHAKNHGVAVDYADSSAEDWAGGHAESYGAATGMEMLEHVPDPVAVIAACADMVEPDGWVFFSTSTAIA